MANVARQIVMAAEDGSQKPFGEATAGVHCPLQHLASRVIAGKQYEEPARGPQNGKTI
jgi:hypothetical protein